MSIQWTPQQNQAITNTQTNLIVTAGAGSGKTATMIERACRLVLDGVPIRRITMLTFTEKAAAEMKEKFRVRLTDALRVETDAAKRDYLIDQVDALPYSSICTIDSYCYTLVREHFEQIPLSPTVRILDENSNAYLRRRAFEKLVAAHRGQEAFDNMRTMVGLRSDDNLQQIIFHLYNNMVIRPARHGWLQAAYAAQFDVDFEHTPAVAYIVRYVTGYMQMACQECRRILDTHRDDPSMVKYASMILSRYQSFESCLTYGDLVKAYQDFKAETAQIRLSGNVKLLLGRHRLLMDSIVSGFEKIYQVVGDPAQARRRHEESAPFTKLLFDLVLDFERLFDECKAEQGSVDFADLERYTLQLLQDEELAADIRSRHDYVFVDEFQDINYLQSALIASIAPPDRLFVVGDSKQCIYRFRLAEPRIFLDRVQEWSKEGNNVGLVDNFRSDNGILRFVNRLFSCLMTKDFGGVDYDATEAFHLRDDAPDSGDAVVSVYIPTRESSENGPAPMGIYSVRANATAPDDDDLDEARAIESYIRAHLHESVMVGNKSRELRYSDFAILFSTRKSGKSILQYLQKQGIPLNLDSFASEVGVHEIQQLLQYAYLMDNGQQDYPLLAVMRSAFGGFSDNDLALIRRHGNPYVPFWQAAEAYAALDDELAQKVRDFLAEVDRYRFVSSFTPMDTLLNDILSGTGYWDHLYAQGDGLARVAALKNFLAQVSGMSFGNSLTDFCRYYRQNEPTEADATAGEQEDSVVVSTIHESKGLEYPVVILAACDAAGSGDKDEVNCDGELGVGTYYYDTHDHCRYPTITFCANKLKRTLQNREDKLRLFYVATTRAQSRLLITGSNSCSAANKWSIPAMSNRLSDWWGIALRDDPKLARYCVDLSGAAASAPDKKEKIATLPLEDEKKGTTRYEDVLRYHYPHRSSVDIGKKYTVTSLNQRDNDALPTSFVQEEEYASLGTAYHTVFEYVDYNVASVEQLSAFIDELVADELLAPAEALQLDVQAIWRCLQLPLLQQARNATTMREQRFLLQVNAQDLGFGVGEQVLVQGVIDLVIIENDGVILVDFKHSVRTPATLQRVYKVQMDLYRRAVQQALGLRLKRCVLVEIGRGLVIDMP